VPQHGVSFGEAQTLSCLEESLLLADPDQSEDEDRFVLVDSVRLLLVCHGCRRIGRLIRSLSARKMDRRERHRYTPGWP